MALRLRLSLTGSPLKRIRELRAQKLLKHPHEFIAVYRLRDETIHPRVDRHLPVRV